MSITSAEVAKIIDDEHDPDEESLEPFLIRRFRGVPDPVLLAGLKLLRECILTDHAYEKACRGLAP